MRLAKCAPFTPTLLATNESQQAIATLFAAIREQLSIVEPAHECEPSVTHAWRPKQGPFSRLKNEPEFRPTNSEISSGGVKLKQLRSANSCPKISYNRIGGPRQFQKNTQQVSSRAASASQHARRGVGTLGKNHEPKGTPHRRRPWHRSKHICQCHSTLQYWSRRMRNGRNMHFAKTCISLTLSGAPSGSL